ncbi:hypothetical protein PG991_002082 [Apiospora marii]|uniref:Uncharacterized protein n=1 Tax=Apiospora marii TaxID=335849 RepID=A0ABR1SNW4_9PEZI
MISTFYRLAEKAPELEEESERKERKRLLAYTMKNCTAVQDGVGELIYKFVETYGRGRSDIRIVTIWTRVLWVIRRPDMEELQLKMNQTKQNLSLLTGFLMLEEARRQPNNDDKIRELEMLIREANESCKQARRELREYCEKHINFNNATQQKLDDLIVSTKAIEKHISHALRTEDRRQKRARREEERTSPQRIVIGQGLGAPGWQPPSPPPDAPSELGIRSPGPENPSPGPPLWEYGEGAYIVGHNPLYVPPAADDVLPHESVEEAEPRNASRISQEVQTRSPLPPPSPPTGPPGNDGFQADLVEESQPRGPPTPPPEVRQRSPAPPSIAIQLANDLIRDQRVEEARPPEPSSIDALEVKRRKSPVPSPPPPPPPPATSGRRRPRRALISEERGHRPTDAKNYTTNTTARNVSPPRTQPKERRSNSSNHRGGQ